MTAQAVLHRELFHIHSSLRLILTILRGPWDTLASPLADAITCPHLLAQLRGLEASIDQTKRAAYTTLDYTEQLLTTFGLMHITRFDRDHARLIAELHGQTSFLDPRLISLRASFLLSSTCALFTSSLGWPFFDHFDTYHRTGLACGDYTSSLLVYHYGAAPSYEPFDDDSISIPFSTESPVYHPVSTRLSTKKDPPPVFFFYFC